MAPPSRSDMESHEQSVPGAEPDGASGPAVRIDARPSLHGRKPIQVLVRADDVVPEGEDVQGVAEFPSVGDGPSVETRFQGPEQPFDPPVLPRTPDLGALMANARPFEAGAEQA